MHRSPLCPLSYSRSSNDWEPCAICIGQQVAGAPGRGNHYPGRAHLLVTANLVVSKGLDLNHIKNLRLCKANKPKHHSPSPGSFDATDLWTLSIIHAEKSRRQAVRDGRSGRDDKLHRSIYCHRPQNNCLRSSGMAELQSLTHIVTDSLGIAAWRLLRGGLFGLNLTTTEHISFTCCSPLSEALFFALLLSNFLTLRHLRNVLEKSPAVSPHSRVRRFRVENKSS